MNAKSQSEPLKTAENFSEAPLRAVSMPPAARWAVFGLVGAVVAGALYLLAVRGDALLADLAAIAALICG